MEQLAALGLAIFYLAVVAAGACSALWILLWLFGEAPGERQGPAHGDVDGAPGTVRSGPAGVRPAPAVSEHSKEKAA